VLLEVLRLVELFPLVEVFPLVELLVLPAGSAFAPVGRTANQTPPMPSPLTSPGAESPA